MKAKSALLICLMLWSTLPSQASDNSKSKGCPGSLMGPPAPGSPNFIGPMPPASSAPAPGSPNFMGPPAQPAPPASQSGPPGPGWTLGYEGKGWIPPNQDPGAAVDVSQQTIAAPIMLAAGAYGAPALFYGLSATSSALVPASGVVTVVAPAIGTSLSAAAVNGAVTISIDAGAAAGSGGGIIVAGAPGGLNQLAIAIYNYALQGSTAAMALDFTTPTAAAASGSFIRVLAANALGAIIRSGVVPSNWTVNGIQMTIDQLNKLWQDINPSFGDNPSTNTVAVNPPNNPTPTDLSSAVADASISGGGAADGGDIASVIGPGCGGGS